MTALPFHGFTKLQDRHVRRQLGKRMPYETSEAVAVIGLGSMGLGVAGSLISAGMAVSGFDPAEAALENFTTAGGRAARNPADAAQDVAATVVVVVNADLQRRQRFVTQQIHYTLEAREAEYELLPISVDQGLGVLVWSPLAAGLLSGKHRRNQAIPNGSRQFAGWTEPPIRDQEKLWRIVDVLVEIGDARGVSAAQIALAWLLGRPAITSLVVGGRNAAQFQDNLNAVYLVLTPDETRQLDEVSAIPMIYPYWHQHNFARDRFSTADLALHGGGPASRQ